jgi:O-antigen ligase
MTFTRGAWVSTIIATLFVALTFKGHRKILFGSIALCAVVALVLMPAIRQSSMYTERITSQDEIEGRIYVTRVSLNMFKHHPLFGCGFNNLNYYKSAYRVNLQGINKCLTESHSHNTFLTILVEMGLVGLLPYLVLLGIVGNSWVRAYRRAGKDSRYLLAATGGCILCYLMTSVIIDMRLFDYSQQVFLLLLALVTVQHSWIMGDCGQNEKPGNTEGSKVSIPNQESNFIQSKKSQLQCWTQNVPESRPKPEWHRGYND